MSNQMLWIGTTIASLYAGVGVLKGLAPESSDPAAPDGRFKIMNVPAAGRIIVADRRSMALLRSTRSRPDGTWEIRGLDPDVFYTVIGFDDRGTVNAAIQDWVKPHLQEP